MTKLELLKSGVGFLVGVGVSQIVGGIVGSNVPQNSMYQKVPVFFGKVGISMAVSEAAKSAVNKEIDDVAEWYNNNVR